MAKCDYCNKQIPKAAKFCNYCGEEQIDSLLGEDIIEDKKVVRKVPETKNNFIMVLAILTIIGSVFGLFRGMFYQAISEDFGNSGFSRGWIYAILNIGTLVAAILLINRSKMGLYMYTFFQVLYLCFVVYVTFIYSQQTGDIGDAFVMLIALFFIIPSLAVLVMYWLPQNVKNLK